MKDEEIGAYESKAVGKNCRENKRDDCSFKIGYCHLALQDAAKEAHFFVTTSRVLKSKLHEPGVGRRLGEQKIGLSEGIKGTKSY